MFKSIFVDRFCCGWFAALLFIGIVVIFALDKWWQLLPTVITIYIGFRHAAFKYSDE
ncbi:hypothetical protein KAU51_03725 [Candidatus Parcubacteria bacterium]|nr:hypothetical protein [Candidatus Parcubacteria bacterium]